MYTQVLKVEIDGCHPEFDHRHTPGIVEKLRVIAKVDLVETSNDDLDEDGNDLGITSLKVDEKDLHLVSVCIHHL
jgi:hypothetical protein